jgi:hypothetical protein
LFDGVDSGCYVVHRPIELLLCIRTHLHPHPIPSHLPSHLLCCKNFVLFAQAARKIGDTHLATHASYLGLKYTRRTATYTRRHLLNTLNARQHFDARERCYVICYVLCFFYMLSQYYVFLLEALLNTTLKYAV